MEKKWIEEQINQRYFGVDDFDGPIDEVIKKIQEWKMSAEKLGYRNVRVYADQYYEDVTVKVIGEREETDEAFARRKKRSEAAKAASKKASKKRKENERAKDLKELERLKKKYEEV